MMKLARRSMLITLVAALACGDDPSGPSGPFEVSVARESLVVMAGDTVHIDATVADTTGATVRVRPSYASSDTTIARVSGDGVVTGRSAGVAEVRVAAGGDTVRVSVEVTRGASSISLGAMPESIAVGSSYRIQPVAFDSLGEELPGARPIVYTSSDTTVALVDSTGRVTAVGAGDAVIQVRVGPLRGQLPARSRLARIGGGLQWATLDAGDLDYACALTVSGAPYCWGIGFNGRLGSPGTSYSAKAVSGGHVFREPHAGYSHSCGIAADSTAWCWGPSRHGQLGNAAMLPGDIRYLPYQEETRRRWAVFSAGGHGGNCASDPADSLVYCWGHNDIAQLGLTRTLRRHPASGNATYDVWGPTRSWLGMKVRALALGNSHSCMISVDGEAWCSSDSPQWAVGEVRPDSTPWRVNGDRFTQIGVGYEIFSCGLRDDGRVLCWGTAENLGTGDTGRAYLPAKPIASDLRFDELQVGSRSACARAIGGDWWCWGASVFGRSATGQRHAFTYSSVPVRLELPFTWRTIRPSDAFTCGLTTANQIYCWGEGEWFGPNPTLARAAAPRASSVHRH